MNLRVNLIADNERRSASIVTPKFLVMLLSTLIVLGLGVLIGGIVFAAQRDAAKLTREQWIWERSQEGFNRSKALTERRDKARTFMNDLELWRKSCNGWSERLTELAPAVPASLRLTELRLVREIKNAPDKPVVSGELRLSGRTESPSAATDVAILRDAFSVTALSNGVTSASIPPDAFRQDPSQNASAEARIFEIVCNYAEEGI